ncbi:hypothetical protein HAHE_40900 [Haloferula helveola]|uniref:Uncharacterized protein n=1 Tax=Haloferula helveola TaxID=490095 RepID=A0ABM7REL8_9BACT|nr:hypothetical protein HAHE_40900 [Haloferula helveola]
MKARIDPLCLALCLATAAVADVPSVLHHQGRITVSNVNFDGTGNFRFALFTDPDTNHASGNEVAIWKNDDPSPTDLKEPVTALSLVVAKGLYSVRLGESPQAGLPGSLIPPPGENLYLRVWFDNGVNGIQQLTPDQQISSVAFARHADITGLDISSLNNDAGYLAPDGSGDVSVAGDYRYTTARTFKMRIPAAAFTPTGISEPTRAPGGTLSEASGLNTVAALNLPEGATIQSIKVHCDSTAGTLQAKPWACTHTPAGTPTVVESLSMTVPSANATYDFPLSTPHTVQADTFYSLEVNVLSASGTLYGAEITYTLDTVTP